VPNLLEPDARSTLIVSKNLDIAVPVERHEAVKVRLRELRGLQRSEEEPSVWLPLGADLLEVNFIGLDTRSERAGETYVLEDSELPLLVFANLALLRPGKTLEVEGLAVPVPRPAGLLLENMVAQPSDLEELETQYRGLSAEQRYAVRSGLSALSLLEPRIQMPDPTPHRAHLARLMARLEKAEPEP